MFFSHSHLAAYLRCKYILCVRKIRCVLFNGNMRKQKKNSMHRYDLKSIVAGEWSKF